MMKPKPKPHRTLQGMLGAGKPKPRKPSGGAPAGLGKRTGALKRR